MGIEAATQLTEATPETPALEPTTVAPKPPPSESVSRHFALLAKKEKAIQKEKDLLRQQRAAIDADRARIAELEAKYGAKPSSPREALTRYGWNYRDATEFELNDGAPTAEQLARQSMEEVRKLRDEQAARDQHQLKQAQDRAQAEAQATVDEFKTEIKDYVAEKPDDYELIRFHDAEEVVYHTVEEHYNKTGKLLSIPEAANMVEKYLEDRAAKMQQTKKLAKQRQEAPAPSPEAGFVAKQEPAKSRTLSNQATSSTPTLVKSPQVEADRMKRALAALG